MPSSSALPNERALVRQIQRDQHVLSLMGQFGKWNNSKMSGTQENSMPNDSHQRAAEFHELAAHAHRAAAAHHGKEDHLTGHELSKQALEHANKASQWSQEAHRKSAKAAGKP